MIEKKTYFVAGSYGVGKSSICKKISIKLNLPYFSAGDIISGVNNEDYSTDKFVSDKEMNQIILENIVNKILCKQNTIILAGHFCIFNKFGVVEKLPEYVYTNLHLKKIILLESNTDIILNNLIKRDNKKYAYNSIVELQKLEKEQAYKISNDLHVPLYIHSMKFDDSDLEKIAKII